MTIRGGPVIIIDMITKYLAKKVVPAGAPNFYKLGDGELLSLIGWAEKWPLERVYDFLRNNCQMLRQILVFG